MVNRNKFEELGNRYLSLSQEIRKVAADCMKCRGGSKAEGLRREYHMLMAERQGLDGEIMFCLALGGFGDPAGTNS